MNVVSDIRAIGESEGYKRSQGQLLGTLRTAQDSREIRQNPTNNEHDHRNFEHFHLTIKSLIDANRPTTKSSICR
jgi:hypothetical protein